MGRSAKLALIGITGLVLAALLLSAFLLSDACEDRRRFGDLCENAIPLGL